MAVGTTATLAAFGGRTWEEGTKPLLQRINKRGYLSLACLILALIMGATKEVLTQRQDTHRALVAQQEQTALSDKLADSKHQLDTANKALDAVRRMLDLTQDRLGDTQSSLSNVRSTLNSATDQLNQDRTTNLITALAEADQGAKGLVLMIPFTSKARQSLNFHEAFLPSFTSSVCRDMAGVEVALLVQRSRLEVLKYVLTDDAPEHERDEQEFHRV